MNHWKWISLVRVKITIFILHSVEYCIHICNQAGAEAEYRFARMRFDVPNLLWCWLIKGSFDSRAFSRFFCQEHDPDLTHASVERGACSTLDKGRCRLPISFARGVISTRSRENIAGAKWTNFLENFAELQTVTVWFSIHAIKLAPEGEYRFARMCLDVANLLNGNLTLGHFRGVFVKNTIRPLYRDP